MLKTYKFLVGFLKSELRFGTLFRLASVTGLSFAAALYVIHNNYNEYWKGTIYRTQTVDFNILANVIPSKLSILLSGIKLNPSYKQLLQETLDSNYGLFGIVITDCKTANKLCQNEKVLYATSSLVEKLSNGKQRLNPSSQYIKYAKNWTEKYNSVSQFQESLNFPFVFLYDNPPLSQEWGYKTPREDIQVSSDKVNTGKIIGRAYFIRSTIPLFQEEIKSWFNNVSNSFFNLNSDKVSSRDIIYNSIIKSATATGLCVFFLMELAYYFARLSQEREARAIKAKASAEQKLIIANQNSEKARRDREIAESKLNLAIEKSKQSSLELSNLENQLDLINQQTHYSKENFENEVCIAKENIKVAAQDRKAAEELLQCAEDTNKSALLEKQKAEEYFFAADNAREEARKARQTLFALETSTDHLTAENDRLKAENTNLKAQSSFNHLFNEYTHPGLELISDQKIFFYWIDSEPRLASEVKSWLNKFPELCIFLKVSEDGHTYLNAFGSFYFKSVKELVNSPTQVTWPKKSNLQPERKNNLSSVEHHRPRGWEKFVDRLCEIEWVCMVSYDARGHNCASAIKKMNNEIGSAICRFGPPGEGLPLKIQTTATNDEELELVINYIYDKLF
jgi:hypothetical protein